MNTLERIEKLEREIAELKAEATQFPQAGDKYWSIKANGELFSPKWEEDLISHEKRMRIGNVFKSIEEADFESEKLEVEAKLRKFAKSPNASSINWFIVCADTEDVYTLYTTQEISQGTIYFESKKVAQQAIKAVGEDRIKKYLFGNYTD